MRKICFITGSRAEYGLLKNLIKLFKNDKNFKIQLIVTGSHLHKKFGLTYNYIKQDGFNVDKKINILDKKTNSDTPASIVKSTGTALIKFGNTLEKLNPDAIILLGDRYEILAAAIAASFQKIPIFHFHGGETTEGAIDESIRHSITKMSTLHFAANDIYKKRIIQLGENPKNVFNVGGMGVDHIKNFKVLDKLKLEQKLNLQFLSKIFLITFHPTTLEKNTAKKHVKILLNSLNTYKQASLIFTYPNADMYSNNIIKEIHNFVKRNKNASVYKSLGQDVYFSILRLADLVIGNSSSGIIEAPYFNTPTINIGDRQKGRVKDNSIIDVKSKEIDIKNAIKKGLSMRFLKKSKKNNYVYGKTGASMKAYKIIKKRIKDIKVSKKFYDIKF